MKLLKVIVKGKAQGNVIKSQKPLNFLGAVNKKTGSITDESHDLFGKSIKNKILIFPFGLGSSVGAYTIYSLKANNSAPAAMLCLKPDLAVASGCALANIPFVIITQDFFDSVQDGQSITLDSYKKLIL